MPKPEGYRYVRQYNTAKGQRWALYEVQNERARRTGTAVTRREYLVFLRLSEDLIKRSLELATLHGY